MIHSVRSSRFRAATFAAALALTVAVAAPLSATFAQNPAAEPASELLRMGPGPAYPDVFYPGFDPRVDTLPEPRRGGRITVHLSAKPKHLNYMVENSATTRRMLYEVHEFLIQRDWESWEFKPVLAESWVTEDSLLLRVEHPLARTLPDGSKRVFGRVSEDGSDYVVAPVSTDHPLVEPLRIPKADVESLQRETVFTFDLRTNVKWHDGKSLDADDVLFSYLCYRNPSVDCDSVRFQYNKLLDAQKLSSHRIRFFYSEQYFLAKEVFSALTVLPSHRYNLRDPEHAEHKPGATDEELGRYINEHPLNTNWIGLGPYRITGFSEEVIVAQRFDEYFDPANGGYVDEIRWRHIADDDAAVQALQNGQLDFFARLKSEQYFGSVVRNPRFQEEYYAGYHNQPYLGYTAWNTRRAKLSDPMVRGALNMAFDWDEYLRTVALGLGERATGTAYMFGEYYDRSLEPVPFDLDGAMDQLAEAGWYDRDGDGLVDKDGQALELTFLMPTGNVASQTFAQKYQENLAKIGVRLRIETREWATFLEELRKHNFDCANLAWILTLESDPEQIWHSRWANRPGSNHSGHSDPETDRLIEAIQVELDKEKRKALFVQLQRRIYSQNPYMFGLHVPIKFAMSKRIRNFQIFAPDPCYSLRRWYVVDDQ